MIKFLLKMKKFKDEKFNLLFQKMKKLRKIVLIWERIHINNQKIFIEKIFKAK